jgi:hypothetical protein
MVWTPRIERYFALAMLDRMTGFQISSQFWVCDAEVASRKVLSALVVSAKNKSESHARN